VQKILITFCLLLLTLCTVAQRKPTVVKLISSAKTIGAKNNGVDFFKVYNGTFQHENSTLQSDSAYFYPKKNSFDAFGHVVIHQADTLNIYADLLNYNGNTHIAILTNHVVLVDKDATLTTDHLNYNTQTRYGTYVEGGKLTQKENTLVSRNGYYFAFSRDAYFRYNVVLTGKDALVKSDTMRYNSNSKIAYFYGPTHIYQKTDTLYTEFGTYNTITQQALGTKNNRYDSGSRTLVGDTLLFDDLKGFGRATHHIVFNDNEQRINLRGDLANYYREQERTVVTKNAYVIFVTEQRDSVNRDSLKHPEKYAVKEAVANPKNTAGTKNSSIKTGSPNKQSPTKNQPVKTPTAKLADAEKPVRFLPKDTVITRRDSIYMTADTLETQIITHKIEKQRREKMRLYGLRDTSLKARTRPKPRVKGKNELEALQVDLRNLRDTTYMHREFFGKVILPPAEKKRAPDTAALRKARLARQDSVRKAMEKDPVYATRKIALSDTARVRIITAWHHAKIYKSDLQAVADSITFSNSDSLVRLYIKPIIWTEGSQLTADTTFLQLKNKKLDNMDLIRSSFVVNTQGDSTYFNQVSGKKIRGIFRNNRLSTLFVDGNAESLYYTYEKNQADKLNHTLSSRIRIELKENKPSVIALLSKPDAQLFPVKNLKEDEKILKGFIWKPKDRPVSKESIIPGLAEKSKKATRPPKPKVTTPVITKPDLARQTTTKK
jgi:lipopolysaccharide export system protein LptA